MTHDDVLYRLAEGDKDVIRPVRSSTSSASTLLQMLRPDNANVEHC